MFLFYIYIVVIRARPVVNGKTLASRDVTPEKSLNKFAEETFKDETDLATLVFFSEDRNVVARDSLVHRQIVYVCKTGECPPDLPEVTARDEQIAGVRQELETQTRRFTSAISKLTARLKVSEGRRDSEGEPAVRNLDDLAALESGDASAERSSGQDTDLYANLSEERPNMSVGGSDSCGNANYDSGSSFDRRAQELRGSDAARDMESLDARVKKSNSD